MTQEHPKQADIPQVLAGAFGGTLLAIPLSYFIQTPAEGAKVNFFDYTAMLINEPQMFADNGFLGFLVLASFIGAFAGAAFGFFDSRGDIFPRKR